MFFKNLIPALVKLMIWIKDDLSKKMKKSVFFNFCHFSNGKSIHFEMSAATKKMSFEDDVLGIVRLTQARDTFLPTTQKERKGEKERKSQKKCQKGIKSRMVPQVVQNKAFGEGTRRAVNEVTLVWSQKLIQKDAFDLQKMIRNPVEF